MHASYKTPSMLLISQDVFDTTMVYEADLDGLKGESMYEADLDGLNMIVNV